MPARPHVVLLLCDQLRADALGFMGSPVARTPNLDRLASLGAVFENLFCQVPVCMGSRACLLTGRYARANRMAGGSALLDPRETTWPAVLQAAGYRTGLFGKLHLTPQQYTRETLQSEYALADPTRFLADAGLPAFPAASAYGFAEAAPHEDILWGHYLDWLGGRDAALAARIRAGGRGAVRQEPGIELPPVLSDVGALDLPVDLHPSAYISDQALDFFQRHHEQAPCLLHVSFVDPHHPFDPPAELLRHYPAATMPLPAHSDTGDVVWPQCLKERTPDFSTVTPAVAQTTIACYHAMVECIDIQIGRLLDAIEGAGALAETLFVFTADHGEYLGSYGLWRKGSYPYDCLLRVPGIVAAPGRLPPGQRYPGLRETVDLMPTLLSLAGVAPPPGLQGLDVSAGLQQGAVAGRDSIWCEMYQAQWGPFTRFCTVRTEQHKLNYFPHDRITQLFDLDADPAQRHCLAAAAPALRREMSELLFDRLYDQADPLPLVTTQY